MTDWNLPNFRDRAVFPKPAGGGAKGWQLADASLAKLAASLKVDADAFIDPHEPVRAVPDPWAQARTFAEALLSGNRDHPLYAPALAQWRGLLALFALAELYDKSYTITARRFALDGNGVFDRVLGHLTPQFAIGGKVELWAKPLLISLNGQVVAMGNPGCLVSPGRLTPDLGFAAIPWYRDGLRDPLACGLPVTQLFLLAQWTRTLRDELADQPGAVTDRIRQLLLDYATACEQEIGEQSLSARFSPTLHPEFGKPYSALFASASLGRIADPSSTSRTKLKLAPGLGYGKLKGLILVDEALAHDPRFGARNTLIWGTRVLAELLNSPELFQSVASEAAAAGWMLVTGKDLFTPRVARLENEAAIPGNPRGMEEMLVPLRPLALLLAGPARETVTARYGGGKAVFTLPLEFDGGTRFDFTRHYSANPTGNEGLLVSDEDWNIYHTTLWPDFRSSAWRSYFARFNYPESKIKYMVRPTHAISAALIADEVSRQETPFAAAERLRQLNAGERFAQRKDHYLHSQRRVTGEHEDVQFSTTPFEAIAYVDAFGDRGDAPAGLAFLNLPLKEPSGGAFDVAVDFGTTNTVACMKDGTPIRFGSRLVFPLVFASPEVTGAMLSEASWLLSRFLPPDPRITPTPTVALSRVPFPSAEAHHVFRNLIYFHSYQQHADNSETRELFEFKRIADDAKFDLKWSEDAEHAEASTDFLTQFVMMVAAEALAMGRDPRRIRWRFSVPDSLDGEMRSKFEDSLRDITRSISTALERDEDVLANLFSEGLAAAEFILDGGAGFTRGSINIVLDIGGGTTDVTIWDYGPIQWIGSFRIAGQNFFTRAISQNPDILKQINLGHWVGLFEAGDGAIEGVGKVDIPHLAEMLFSGPALNTAIDEHWNSRLRLDTGKDLRLIAQTFLGGLAWYIGRIVRELVREGKLQPEDLRTPAFALCGRGAGIFKKMHAGRGADTASEATAPLQVFALAAESGAATLRPQLFTTPDAKLEVVRGMIASSGDRSDMAADASRTLVAGLAIALDGGTTIAADAPANRASLSAATRGADLGELKAFLAALEGAANIHIDLFETKPQGAFSAIQLEVVKSLNALRDNKDRRKELEPPFITALRALVDLMAKPAKERDTRLKMEFRR